ncbi:MAG: ankyrin repeat domain-containing protein [Pyrinomonadaceae bacterium]
MLRVACLLVVSFALASAACVEQPREVSPETARQELALRGIPYDAQHFVSSASEGDVWAVKLFLAAGMSPDVKDEHGATPLVAAMQLKRDDVARALLQKSQNVNLRDRDGMTPLTRAVERGESDLVALLLARGADANLADKDGWTPLMYAARTGD